MSVYGHSILRETTMENVDVQPFVELFICDDITKMDSNSAKQFCESTVAQVLSEKSVLKKPTMMRLSRADDEARRIKLCAYQLAKEDNDPNWKKMVMYREKWKEYRGLVMKKYGAKAIRMAKIAQKEYIKKAQKGVAAEPAKKEKEDK